MIQIQVDKNIPMPKQTRGRTHQPKNASTKYPFLSMEIGDSFFVGVRGNLEARMVRLSSIRACSQRHRPRLFSGRVLSHGVRVWRVK